MLLSDFIRSKHLSTLFSSLLVNFSDMYTITHNLKSLMAGLMSWVRKDVEVYAAIPVSCTVLPLKISLNHVTMANWDGFMSMLH